MPSVKAKSPTVDPAPEEVWTGKKAGTAMSIVALVDDGKTRVVVYRPRVYADGPYFAMPLRYFREGYEKLGKIAKE